MKRIGQSGKRCRIIRNYNGTIGKDQRIRRVGGVRPTRVVKAAYGWLRLGRFGFGSETEMRRDVIKRA